MMGDAFSYDADNKAYGSEEEWEDEIDLEWPESEESSDSWFSIF